MYTTQSGSPPLILIEEEMRHSNFPFFMGWTNSFNNQHVFQTGMTKHLTPLIYSLLPTLICTPTQYLPLLAPLITVLLLSPHLLHHLLPSLPPHAAFGTMTVCSVLRFPVSMLITLGGIVASVLAIRIRPLLVSLRSCLPGWRHTSPPLSHLSLHLNLGLIMRALELYKRGSVHTKPLFALAPI